MAQKHLVVCDWCDKEEPAANQDGAYPISWCQVSRGIGGWVCSAPCAVYWLARELDVDDVVVPWTG